MRIMSEDNKRKHKLLYLTNPFLRHNVINIFKQHGFTVMGDQNMAHAEFMLINRESKHVSMRTVPPSNIPFDTVSGDIMDQLEITPESAWIDLLTG